MYLSIRQGEVYEIFNWCAFFLISSGAFAGQEFSGINFGVGISLTHNIGDKDRVDSASLDENGVVRIDKEGNSVARVMLEMHKFFTPNKFNGSVGHGPFIALQPGSEETIEAFGLGWMIGFKMDDSEESSRSWNLGLGYVVDPSVNKLGDGIEPNEQLPEGESQIRYKESSQGGVFLLFSTSF